MLIQGYTDREISLQLAISENTVKVYLARILSKIEAKNKNEAIQIVLRKLDPNKGAYQ